MPLRPLPLPTFFDNDCFIYEPNFLSAQAAGDLWQALARQIVWQQEQISLFGRNVNVPRKVAWCGDQGVEYTYSNTPHRAQGWHSALADLRLEVEQYADARFNFALLNRYEHGACYMGWHSDDEAALGDAPTIASLSLGATRRFRVRPKRRPAANSSVASQAAIERQHNRTSEALDLVDGSLLLMRGASQKDFEHCLTKTKRVVDVRINLTFRCVY